MNETRLWYAVYTRPRWEKKVDALLQRQKLPTYCPLNKVKRKWSDRYKIVEMPLFPSYVFVHITEAEKTPVRMVDGVVNFVYWQGKPAIIREEEIDLIKRFLGEYQQVEVQTLVLTEGQRVRILTGAFTDQVASVVKDLHKRAVVKIESLGVALVATIEKTNIKVV
jgi:transcription antitermination factor NusG